MSAFNVSIPLEQGRVFRQRCVASSKFGYDCLNPFGTGQGLSTVIYYHLKRQIGVSIPLEQGRVFRLSNLNEVKTLLGLNPFGTGQGLSTN